MAVQGPMGRTVADIALQMSVIAGPDPRSPISIEEPATLFSQPLERDCKGLRIAWSRDLDGLPIDAEVTRVLEAPRNVF